MHQPLHPRLTCIIRSAIVILSATAFIQQGPAAIIGTNPPVPPLTLDRIQTLPADTRKPWQEYLRRSTEQRERDQAFFRREMERHGLTNSTPPPSGKGNGGMPLGNRPAWYAGEAARTVADHIISFQTPAGGWGKNINLAAHARAPGEFFGPENGSHYLKPGDFDAPLEGSWSYVGTIDNSATTSELRFLAKVIAAGQETNTAYRAAFTRGLDYLLAAQYPNGGWPQVWPLQGGYHDAVTLNDGAMLNVLELLRNISEGAEEFAFLPTSDRERAATGFTRGLHCLLAIQVVVKDRRTIWCQQYEAVTLLPASARNYEMPSLATGESGGILNYLMRLPNPSPETVRAVHAAAAWFQKTRLMNVAFRNEGSTGRHLVPAPGNGPLWARYYEIGDDKPIFGDRDKTIHDTIEEISFERRKGYAWFTDSARRALELYPGWSRQHPLKN